MTTVNFAKRKVSRAAATLLTVVLTMTATTAWADPTFLTRGDGQGTEADPYKITSASDLRDLTVYVNGSGTYSNSGIIPGGGGSGTGGSVGRAPGLFDDPAWDAVLGE